MPPSLLFLLRPLFRIQPSRVSGVSQRIVVATRAARTPRPFSSGFGLSPSPPLLGKNVNFPPRPKPPPDEEIDESFLKGSGPGGQKINKTNSAVQLKHLPTGIVIKSQATRSRSQNRIIARQLLADKLDQITRGDESRSAVVGEVKRKRKASSAKKSRRKYRKLDDEKATKSDSQEEEHLEEDDEAEGLEEQQPPDQETVKNNRK
ncbi:peptide chain release factor-like protein [Hypoxylon rubiginosum]|uniref:Peptide chain release factor-like protein n=1 Tax=Hypoxylon rubiginosum TaxID=110542 RepID=A0ACC0DEP2_9PEZI|nr:peptide chain release factor-like protein [Hypoxylon rubiginosum]